MDAFRLQIIIIFYNDAKYLSLAIIGAQNEDSWRHLSLLPLILSDLC